MLHPITRVAKSILALVRGSRVGAVVRALASHQCVPGSIPGPGVICGLSLLLVLYSAPRGFFSGYSGFPLSSKTNTSKFQFDLETVDEEPPRGNATANSYYYLLLLLLLNHHLVHDLD